MKTRRIANVNALYEIVCLPPKKTCLGWHFAYRVPYNTLAVKAAENGCKHPIQEGAFGVRETAAEHTLEARGGARGGPKRSRGVIHVENMG